jgi:N-formylglutamate deformylase
MTFTTNRPAFEFHAGTAPVLLSLPHSGTYLPPAVAAGMTPEARRVSDTDWHLPRLYEFANGLGASVLAATHSRYVIDVNRPADGPDVRHGERVTGVCPMETFDVLPIYLEGQTPCADEIAARLNALWHPYHRQLSEELARIRAEHGVAVLWDAHSLRSHLSHYWDGRLPDLNLGTHKGASCDPALAAAVMHAAQQACGFSSSINGRFTGGHITRHYGRPDSQVHAFQCEIAQCTYMREEPPFDYLPDVARRLQPHLRRMMEAALAYARERA